MTHPKANATDPEQRLRELISEAHGAAKDLRQAIREAHVLQGEIINTGQAVIGHIQAEMEEFLAGQKKICEDRMREAALNYIGHLIKLAREVTEHLSRLLGAADITALTKEIVDRVSISLADQLRAEMIIDLPGKSSQDL